ncbi:MAG: sensor histidine kinase [Acidimicrobiales bacterium]
MRPRTRQLGPLGGTAAGTALVGLVALGALPLRDQISSTTAGLLLVVPPMAAALWGGRRAAVATAVIAAVAFNLTFLAPYGTLKIDVLDDAIALVVFVAVAVALGTLVALERERREEAEARAAEIEALSDEQLSLRAEQARLAAAKKVAELAGEHRSALLRSVSHDLRTPLATIRAVTSDLRDGGADYDDKTRDELLDLVVDEAERLDRLVANLLSLSRVEAGALEPDRQAVPIDELLTERVRRLKRLLRDRRIHLDVPFALPLVDVDYTLADQVITNLLENAVRHSPEGSTIRVRARAVDASVEISVSDEGAGIAPDMIDVIFEPFRRGEGGGSSGVGLAICKAIIEAHGGTIVARQANAGGAELAFTVPIRATM